MEQDDSHQVVNGAQANCKVFFDPKKNIRLFKKIFYSQKDYEQEKRIIQEVIDPINRQITYRPFVNLEDFDDYSSSLFFPYLQANLTKICAVEEGLKLGVALFYFTQIAKSIELMHNKNTTHNDIKIDNVLIEIKNNYAQCYVIDFGHCQQLTRLNEMSRQPCGTPTYNPAPFNEEIELLMKGQIKELNEYSPAQLDIFQLGMLFLTLLSPKKIQENNKKLFTNQRMKSGFFTLFAQNHKSSYNKQLTISDKGQSLIWQMLSGQITSVREIFDHEIYDTPNGKKILECIRNSTTQNQEQEIEEELTQNFQNISHNQKIGSDSRNSNIPTNEKLKLATTELVSRKQRLCNQQEQFDQVELQFLEQKLHEISEEELPTGSLTTDLTPAQLVSVILIYLSENNEKILSTPDIFEINESKKTGLKLVSTQIVTSKEVVLKDDVDIESLTEHDDNINETKLFEEVYIKRYVEMSIDIVKIKDSNRISLLFGLIKGEYTDFTSLVCSIEANINEY